MSIFNQVRGTKVKKNVFDMSHDRKMSFNMGDLIPILCEDIVPGDKFEMSTETLIRLAPMLAPVMHRVNVYTHYFFVPNRLIWDEWEDFITGGEDGLQQPIMPKTTVNAGNQALYGAGKLADYLGYNFETLTQNQDINVLPFRAYQTIFNEYYRDQNLEAKVGVEKTSGAITGTERDAIIQIQKRAWEKDYLTSALPWTQRGGEVTTPIGGTADIQLKNPTSGLGQQVLDASTGAPMTGSNVPLNQNSGSMRSSTTQIQIDPANFEADLDGATSTSINELRRAARLQEWLEKNARGGARYIEQILAHFGVRSSDARLQRPEYLGGGKSPVVISEVLQTSESDDSVTNPTPQGHMAGHGIGAGASNAFKKKFKEHGYIIGIMSVLPTTVYQQGVPRHFSRFDKLEYPWPEFAHIGEQEVLNQEVYHDPTIDDTWMAETFGYQSRYAEEKYGVSTVHGDMRDELDYWHMSRIFNGRQALNEDFIKANPTKRIFAVEDGTEDELYCQLYHNISAIRPLPYFSNPRL